MLRPRGTCAPGDQDATPRTASPSGYELPEGGRFCCWARPRGQPGNFHSGRDSQGGTLCSGAERTGRVRGRAGAPALPGRATSLLSSPGPDLCAQRLYHLGPARLGETQLLERQHRRGLAKGTGHGQSSAPEGAWRHTDNWTESQAFCRLPALQGEPSLPGPGHLLCSAYSPSSVRSQHQAAG